MPRTSADAAWSIFTLPTFRDVAAHHLATRWIAVRFAENVRALSDSVPIF
jgi:hypothetical protein